MSKDMVSINGIKLTAKWFAYDGCHKIYTLENEEEKAEAESYDYKVYPISQIRQCYKHSCPLRFIDSWNLENEYIPQFSTDRSIRWGYDPKYRVAL